MQLRAMSVLAAIGVVTFSLGQDLTKKVDYSTKAVTFSQAFTELGMAGGVGLFPEPDLAKEIIILRLHDVSLADAMQKISDVVGGTWVKKSDGYELDRSPELLDKMRDDALNAKAQIFTDTLARQRKAMNVDQPMTQADVDKLVAQLSQQTKIGGRQDWREVARLRNSMPDQRAILRLLEQIDPKAIASMQDGQRLVFSNKPTHMQEEMNGDLSQIAQSLQTEHNRFVDAYAKAHTGDDQPEYYFQAPDAKIVTLPDRFLLTINKQMFGDSLQLGMIAFDGQNHPVCAADCTLQTDDSMSKMMADRARVAREHDKEPEISLSPVTKQLLGFFRRSSGQSGTEPVTGDLRDALLNPERTDPLAFAVSEAFLGIAEQRNENLVAYPDDTMFLVSMLAGMEGSFKPSLILQTVSGAGQILPTTVIEQDGWLTIAPVDRLAALNSRMDRGALGTFLRKTEEDGYTAIRTRSDLAASVRGNTMPTLGLFVPMILRPDSMTDFEGDITMLKVYGSLTDAQIQRLDDKQGLRMAELSADQIGLISQYAFGGARQRNMRPAPGNDKSTFAEHAADDEITEKIPNGLSSDCFLSMTSESSKTYFTRIKSNNSSYVQAMDVSTMAWYAHSAEHPDRGNEDWHPEIIDIQPGEQRTLELHVHLLPSSLSAMSTLKEQRKIAGGPWTLATLPADLKAELDKAKQRFMQAVQADDGDNPTPPPPQTAPPSRK